VWNGSQISIEQTHGWAEDNLISHRLGLQLRVVHTKITSPGHEEWDGLGLNPTDTVKSGSLWMEHDRSSFWCKEPFLTPSPSVVYQFTVAWHKVKLLSHFSLKKAGKHVVDPYDQYSAATPFRNNASFFLLTWRILLIFLWCSESKGVCYRLSGIILLLLSFSFRNRISKVCFQCFTEHILPSTREVKG